MSESPDCKINIFDIEYYNSILDFSKKINDMSIVECLDRLKQITSNINQKKSENLYYELYLYNDFAPYSFYFEIKNIEDRFMNGGIIYHGKHDNGGDGGATTFSVNLTPTKGWAIHT